MAFCAYKNCHNRNQPFSKIAFFSIPRDEPRRIEWIQNSGNTDLLNLPIHAKRFICEVHFEDQYLRKQFHRTTLARDAVPTISSAQTHSRQISVNDDKHVTSSDNIKYVIMEDEVLYERMEDAPSQEADIVMRYGIEDDTHNHPGSSRVMLQYENISTNQGSQNEILYETVETDLNVSMDETSRFPPTYNETATQTTDEPEETECFHLLEFSNVETQTEEQVIVKKDVAVCTSLLYKDIGVGTNDRVIEEEEKGSQTEESRIPSRKRKASEEPTTQRVTSLEKDEDEVFALQMVRPLKKLAPEKRAIAKAKLLTYLIKLECGLDVDI